MSRRICRWIGFGCLPIGVLIISSSLTDARQFRNMAPIPTAQNSGAALPENAVPVANAQPFGRQEVEPLIEEALRKWNTPEMAETLSDQFYDRTRLTDGVDTIAPRDATLRIQSVQGIQTLQQYIHPSEDGGRDQQISIVSATVRTQLEFNDPNLGFVRRQGTNEIILEISTPAPP